MFQKIISSIIILAILPFYTIGAYSPEDQMEAQNRLGEYSKYVPLLEKTLPKIRLERLYELQDTLFGATNQENEDIQNFLQYTIISIDLEIQNRKSLLSDKEITPEDTQKVEEELMFLQTNLEIELSELLNNALVGWSNASRYEEKGTLEVFLNMAFQEFISFEGKFDISNYIAETQMFDQIFSGEIGASYNTNIPGEYGGETDISLNTHANIITKDGNIYVKLDDLQAQSKSSNEYIELDISPFIEKLQDLAENNTYIEIPSEDSLSYIQSFNYNEFSQGMRAQMEEAFGLPLLKIQSKNEMGYSLIPTRHFCNIGKKISGIFDPLAGENCSEKQYKNMLEDFENSGLQINLTISQENTLDISLVNTKESMNMSIAWDKDDILEIAGTFINTASSYMGNRHVNFHFTPKESFIASIGDNNFNTDLSLSMDKNGNIYSGNYTLDIDELLTLQGNYKNKNLLINIEGNNDDSSISCEFEGPLKKEFLNISGGCDIHSPEIEYELPGVRNIRVDSKLSYDGRNQTNNIDFSINMNIDSNNYLDFGLSNIGNRCSLTTKNIVKPINSKDITEFFGEVYSELYDDYGYYEDYEYEFNEYENYSEDCYIYDSGNTTCYKYYDDKTETCEYIAETATTECSEYVYSDWEYELKEYTFDDHTTSCYLYNNGNKTCYEYYNDHSNTCEYIAETDTTKCNEYDFGYTLEETQYEDHSETCYYYDSGDYSCYKYYDNKSVTCNYYVSSEELNCDTYDYANDDYYEETEDAIEEIEKELEDIYKEISEE